MNYTIEFKLRPDTKNYYETDLTAWKETISRGIEMFNANGSKFNDERHMELMEVNDKSFFVKLSVRKYWDPHNGSFYNKAGALSRYLKQMGMGSISSPHGKIFTLNVTSTEIERNNMGSHERIRYFLKEKRKSYEERKKLRLETFPQIYLDYKNKSIMIPKELMEWYCIKFYDSRMKDES